MKKRCGFRRNGWNLEVSVLRINNTNVGDAAEGREYEIILDSLDDRKMISKFVVLFIFFIKKVDEITKTEPLTTRIKHSRSPPFPFHSHISFSSLLFLTISVSNTSSTSVVSHSDVQSHSATQTEKRERRGTRSDMELLMWTREAASNAWSHQEESTK
ncbi:hypothetical protein Csa_007566 [Cucumis sativus]|uniref:Uncharacterized protein n=1 Tax=Cucumis sativus TaxID=3659 RepID=A0A0A0LYB8_CUCSA|nr:hypothetical protein Csa_007566 [Cucumis sativus]